MDKPKPKRINADSFYEALRDIRLDMMEELPTEGSGGYYESAQGHVKAAMRHLQKGHRHK